MNYKKTVQDSTSAYLNDREKKESECAINFDSTENYWGKI